MVALRGENAICTQWLFLFQKIWLWRLQGQKQRTPQFQAWMVHSPFKTCFCFVKSQVFWDLETCSRDSTILENRTCMEIVTCEVDERYGWRTIRGFSTINTTKNAGLFRVCQRQAVNKIISGLEHFASNMFCLCVYHSWRTNELVFWKESHLMHLCFCFFGGSWYHWSHISIDHMSTTCNIQWPWFSV